MSKIISGINCEEVIANSVNNINENNQGLGLSLFYQQGDDIMDTTSLNIAADATDNKYSGGVLAPNGKIYCIPNSATNVLIIDPLTNTLDTTTISGLSGNFKWAGGVLAPNGKIYLPPHNASTVAIIDPSNDTIDVVTITGVPGAATTNGGCLAPNGKIFCAPKFDGGTGIVLIIDTLTDTIDTTSITGLSGAAFAVDSYNGVILGSDGNIYINIRGLTGSPHTLIINPNTLVHDTTTLISDPDTRRSRGCIAQNGVIYTTGEISARSYIQRIDTTVDPPVYITPTISHSGNSFNHNILAPNGKIYCIPRNIFASIGIIDTLNSDAYSTLSFSLPSTDSYEGGCVAQNGIIYLIPKNDVNVGILKPAYANNVNLNRCISAYYNKF